MSDGKSSRRARAREEIWSDSDSSSSSSSSDSSFFETALRKNRVSIPHAKASHEEKEQPKVATSSRNSNEHKRLFKPNSSRQRSEAKREQNVEENAIRGTRIYETDKEKKKNTSKHNDRAKSERRSRPSTANSGSNSYDDLTAYTRRLLKQRRNSAGDTSTSKQHNKHTTSKPLFRETTRVFTRKVIPKRGLVFTSDGILRRWKSESQELRPAVPHSMRAKLDQRASSITRHTHHDRTPARTSQSPTRHPQRHYDGSVKSSYRSRPAKFESPTRRGYGDPEQYRAYAERVARSFRELQSKGCTSAWGTTRRSGRSPTSAREKKQNEFVDSKPKNKRTSELKQSVNFHEAPLNGVEKNSESVRSQRASKTPGHTRQGENAAKSKGSNAMQSKRGQSTRGAAMWSSDSSDNDNDAGAGDSSSSDDEWFRKILSSKKSKGAE